MSWRVYNPSFSVHTKTITILHILDWLALRSKAGSLGPESVKHVLT